tara:strand:- start:7457 stop:7735 length:279 start_codon:yes stop_codon:yes gene_type:complete
VNPTDNILFRTISDLEDRFGRVFGLRAFPGDRFSISRTHSYVTGPRLGAQPIIYVYRWNDKGEWWQSFSKGDVDECLRTFVVVPGANLEPVT